MASIGIDFSDEFVGALAEVLAPLIAERLRPEPPQWLTAMWLEPSLGVDMMVCTALAR